MKVGDVRFTAPVSLSNEWSTIRIQHKVAGNKLNKKLAVGVPMVENVDGRQVKGTRNMWMHYVEIEVEREFSGFKSKAALFSRANRNSNGEYLDFGKSGNSIKMGAGLREQIEYGNVIYYNRTEGILKVILNALHNLSYSKLGYKDRNVIITTGEWGATLFSQEAKDMASGWLPLISTQNPAVMQKVQSDFAQNAVAITDYQVTEWRAPNGLNVKLVVDPMYDDMTRNKIPHPKGGLAESYRFDIYGMGTTEEPNIYWASVA